MDTVKIDARDVNFWYGDFHALKSISMQIEEKSVSTDIIYMRKGWKWTNSVRM